MVRRASRGEHTTLEQAVADWQGDAAEPRAAVENLAGHLLGVDLEFGQRLTQVDGRLLTTAPPSTTSSDELTSDSMCGAVALITGEPKRVVGLEQPAEDQVESGRLAKLVDDLANDEVPVPLVAVA